MSEIVVGGETVVGGDGASAKSAFVSLIRAVGLSDHGRGEGWGRGHLLVLGARRLREIDRFPLVSCALLWSLVILSPGSTNRSVHLRIRVDMSPTFRVRRKN